MKGPRFWMVAAMLAAIALLLHARPSTDLVPVSEPLTQVPTNVAGWGGYDVQIDQETLSVLGAGDFLSRVYSAPGNRT